MREEKVKIRKEIKEAALSLPNLAMLFTQPVSEFDQCTISKNTTELRTTKGWDHHDIRVVKQHKFVSFLHIAVQGIF